jgi:hypothetical protein
VHARTHIKAHTHTSMRACSDLVHKQLRCFLSSRSKLINCILLTLSRIQRSRVRVPACVLSASKLSQGPLQLHIKHKAHSLAHTEAHRPCSHTQSRYAAHRILWRGCAIVVRAESARSAAARRLVLYISWHWNRVFDSGSYPRPVSNSNSDYATTLMSITG